MNEKPLVVVADDNEDILNLLALRLRSRGYEVETAADGEQALLLIGERLPAAAVLDWVMPVVAGPDVCAAVKANPATADTKIVLLTARAGEQDIVGGFDKGADEYLTKPFDIEELDQVLRRLLSD